MNKNLTEIVIVLDQSGSMDTIKSDMEGALKTFLQDQRKQKGECRITFYRFNSLVEKVFEDKDINSVKDITIKPSGMTALFDGIGQAVDEVGQRLAKLKERERPSKVIFTVISDGLENSSKEYNLSQIKKMIQHQESKYSWEFIYLGANQDAFAGGQNMGFKGGSSITYSASKIGIDNAAKSMSAYVCSVRSGQDYEFSDSDRKNAVQ